MKRKLHICPLALLSLLLTSVHVFAQQCPNNAIHDEFINIIQEGKQKDFISVLSLNEKRDLYLKVASLYLMGEYHICSDIGDSMLFNIQDIYDAMIVCYSSLSNYKLAFEERIMDFQDNVFLPNYSRSVDKATEALDFLSDHIANYFTDSLVESSFLIDILQSCYLAVSCSRILNISQYRLFLNIIHKHLTRVKSILSDDMIVQRLELDYYDIMYNIEKNHITLVIEELLPHFELTIVEFKDANVLVKSQIATLYGQLSEYLNYSVIGQKEKDPALRIAALNTMIHSRDYSFFSKKNGDNNSRFKLVDWNEIKNNMRDNSRALMFFEYAKESDSWNYVWSFTSTSKIPDLEWGGHSYWSESQARYALINYDSVQTFYIVGTNSMMLVDYSNDIRCVRLHNMSDLILPKHDNYSNDNVFVIGNLNYSCNKNLNNSDEKVAVNGNDIGPFSTAKREIEAIQNVFGRKVSVFQGDTVTARSFATLVEKKGLLHISTHGKYDKDLLNKLNKINPIAGVTGENIFRSCILMLSGYNDDNNRNAISGYDIKDLELSGFDLVFISACESGSGKVLLLGDFSLVESFHLAGAHNIIAFIDPINEVVATKFAELFYMQVSKGVSYHDAFYYTKKQVCPNVRVILFE